MAPLVLLTDHSAPEVLPALPSGYDVKVEPLSADAPRHLLDLSALALLIDAVSDPQRALRVARAARTWRPPVTIVMVVRPEDLERFPWAEVADDVVLTDASAAEIRLRLELLARRTGEGGDATIRLGPLALNVDSYQVAVAGRLLDLTYKEFELLRFLVRSPGKGLHAERAAASGLGLRLLRRHAHGGRSRAPASGEARSRARDADPDRARGRLSRGRARRSRDEEPSRGSRRRSATRLGSARVTGDGDGLGEGDGEGDHGGCEGDCQGPWGGRGDPRKGGWAGLFENSARSAAARRPRPWPSVGSGEGDGKVAVGDGPLASTWVRCVPMGRMRWRPAAAATPRKITQPTVSTTAPLASKRGRALPRDPRRLMSLSRSRTTWLPRGPIVPHRRHLAITRTRNHPPGAQKRPRGAESFHDLRAGRPLRHRLDLRSWLVLRVCSNGHGEARTRGREGAFGVDRPPAIPSRRRHGRSGRRPGRQHSETGIGRRARAAIQDGGDVQALHAWDGRMPGLQGPRRAQVLPDAPARAPRTSRVQLPDPEAAHPAEDVEPLLRTQGRLAAEGVRRSTRRR